MASPINVPATPEPSSDKSFDGVSDREKEIIEREEETPEAEETTKEDKEDKEEAPEEVEEEELEPLEESTEEVIEDQPINISFKEVDKAFPGVLKKFPELRANYFLAEKFKEYFPTPADAEAASQKVEAFDYFDPFVANGDFSPFIEGLKNSGNANALENTAQTILPSLQKANPQLYIQALTPELKKLFGLMLKRGQDNEDDNLTAAAKVAIKFLWGDTIPQDPEPRKDDPEKLQLQQRLQQQTINTLVGKETETKDKFERHFVKEIEKSLDPNGEISETLRGVLVEKIGKEIDNSFRQNVKLQKEFNSLWLQYARSNFSKEAESRLIRAFLGRAKSVLPAIAQKYRNEALGKRSSTVDNKTKIGQSSTPSRARTAYVSPKEAKAKHMSEMDIIMAGSK